MSRQFGIQPAYRRFIPSNSLPRWQLVAHAADDSTPSQDHPEDDLDDDDVPPPEHDNPHWWEEFGTDFDDNEPLPEPGDFWADEDVEDGCSAGEKSWLFASPYAGSLNVGVTDFNTLFQSTSSRTRGRPLALGI
ncbi:MAG TPA: hypothetical protein VGG64_25035 [Pirellulales bacterium]|jgi:hypothetical protein